jgi:hypothetical protein
MKGFAAKRVGREGFATVRPLGRGVGHRPAGVPPDIEAPIFPKKDLARLDLLRREPVAGRPTNIVPRATLAGLASDGAAASAVSSNIENFGMFWFVNLYRLVHPMHFQKKMP